MKIVINKCWGGFGLSNEALTELYKRGSAAVKAIEPVDYYGGRAGWERQFREEQDMSEDRLFNVLVIDGKIIGQNYDKDDYRADASLVAVVESLGSKANGRFAYLQVVEVPDGIEWEIDNYDGMESVQEAHRSWG